jgi:hypothetical protein
MTTPTREHKPKTLKPRVPKAKGSSGHSNGIASGPVPIHGTTGPSVFPSDLGRVGKDGKRGVGRRPAAKGKKRIPKKGQK